jgi:DNA-binding NarL/FixJ family response regulator
MCDLKKVLDEKNYRALVRNYGGMRIWIPKDGNPGHREREYFSKRDEKITRLLKQGKSVKEIAQLFNLTERGVYSVITRTRLSA